MWVVLSTRKGREGQVRLRWVSDERVDREEAEIGIG